MLDQRTYALLLRLSRASGPGEHVELLSRFDYYDAVSRTYLLCVVGSCFGRFSPIALYLRYRLTGLERELRSYLAEHYPRISDLMSRTM